MGPHRRACTLDRSGHLLFDGVERRETVAGEIDNSIIGPGREFYNGQLGAAVDVNHLPEDAAALSYFDAYRSARLPANLLQAQRDYFGAHTYEHIDRPRGEYYHSNWTGRGGDTASSTYEA